MSQQEQQEQEPSHFIRLEGPMCLVGVWKVPNRCLKVIRIVSGSLEDVWKVSGRCLEGSWKVSGKCLEDVWRDTGWCLMGAWMVSGGILGGVK